MPCSICRETGHNKTTCQSAHAHTSAPTHLRKKSPKTQKRKASISLTKESLGDDFYKKQIEHFKETREAQYDAALKIRGFLESGKNVAVKALNKH